MALRTLDHLSDLPLKRIKEAGIWRNRKAYFLNISYPSLQAMKTADLKKMKLSRVKNKSRRVAIYIHIPFCTAECYYCHYYKKFSQSKEQVDHYLDAVAGEIKLQKERLGRIEAESIYIGGGTPSYLNSTQIDRLFKVVYENVELTGDAEVSFEIHPESASSDRFEALYRNRVNRINIGVESFEEGILKSENRRHTAKDAIEAYEKAKSIGFSNINLDLIYGLRGQTLVGWEYNLNQIEKLHPPSVTLYYLRLKLGTPEFKLWKSDPTNFPTDTELLLMHAMNFEKIEKELKYIQNPVDWFISNEINFHKYQDHNWRKSDEVDLLGIGASAYSYVDGWQYYNINDTNRYQEMIIGNKLPIWKAEFLDLTERMRRTVMLGIKMGIERNFFFGLYGVDIIDVFAPIWDALDKIGLVNITPEMVELTYSGKLFADEVGQQFYSSQMKQRMMSIDPELVSTTWPQFNL